MNSVKKNLIFSIVFLCIGILLLIISSFGILPEGAQGSTIFGMGCGLSAAGISTTVISFKNYKNPEKTEEIELFENDERNIHLREKTSAKVYSLFTYIECGIIFLASFLGYKEVAMTFSVLVLLKLISWAFIANHYSKIY